MNIESNQNQPQQNSKREIRTPLSDRLGKNLLSRLTMIFIFMILSLGFMGLVDALIRHMEIDIRVVLSMAVTLILFILVSLFGNSHPKLYHLIIAIITVLSFLVNDYLGGFLGIILASIFVRPYASFIIAILFTAILVHQANVYTPPAILEILIPLIIYAAVINEVTSYLSKYLDENSLRNKHLDAENKRLQSFLSLYTATSDKLISQRDGRLMILEEAIQLSESKSGYIAQKNAHNDNVHVTIFSTRKKPALIDEFETPISKMDTLWYEAFINKITIRKDNVLGYTQQMILNRNISVPVLENGEVVIVLGVSDKDSPYTEDDEFNISQLIQGYWLVYKRNALEEQFEKQKIFEEQLFQSAPIFVVVTNLLGEITRINDYATDAFKLVDKSFLHRQFYSVFFDEHQQDAGKKIFLASLSATESIKFNSSIKLNEIEKTISWSCKPIKDAQGHITAVIFVGYDSTERERYLDVIRQTKDRYRSLVETISEFIWEIDVEGIIQYVSPRVTDIVGFFPEELLGRNPLEMVFTDDQRKVGEIFLHMVLEQPKTITYEQRWYTKDERLVVLETIAVPFFDSNDKLIGFRATNKDVSHKYSYEDIYSETQ